MKMFRTPKTLNEMRKSADPETKQYVRGKRRANALPNSWDDKPFSDKQPESHRQKLRSRRSYRDTIRRMEPSCSED